MNMRKLSVEALHPAAYNPRKDLKPTDKEYQKIQKSIREFGYIDPIIVNSDMTIIGGHQRFKVLKGEGYTEVDCVVVDVSKEQEKTLNIALNKIDGAWDSLKLGELLTEMKGLDIDMTLTGFTAGEVESATGAADLAAKISREAEVQLDQEQADDIAANYSKRIAEVAKQHPDKMRRATCVIVSGKGNDALIITDPALGDFVTEMHRLADAGVYSPLAAFLGEAVTMKWN